MSRLHCRTIGKLHIDVVLRSLLFNTTFGDSVLHFLRVTIIWLFRVGIPPRAGGSGSRGSAHANIVPLIKVRYLGNAFPPVNALCLRAPQARAARPVRHLVTAAFRSASPYVLAAGTVIACHTHWGPRRAFLSGPVEIARRSVGLLVVRNRVRHSGNTQVVTFYPAPLRAKKRASFWPGEWLISARQQGTEDSSCAWSGRCAMN